MIPTAGIRPTPYFSSQRTKGVSTNARIKLKDSGASNGFPNKVMAMAMQKRDNARNVRNSALDAERFMELLSKKRELLLRNREAEDPISLSAESS